MAHLERDPQSDGERYAQSAQLLDSCAIQRTRSTLARYRYEALLQLPIDQIDPTHVMERFTQVYDAHENPTSSKSPDMVSYFAYLCTTHPDLTSMPLHEVKSFVQSKAVANAHNFVTTSLHMHLQQTVATDKLQTSMSEQPGAATTHLSNTALRLAEIANDTSLFQMPVARRIAHMQAAKRPHPAAASYAIGACIASLEHMHPHNDITTAREAVAATGQYVRQLQSHLQQMRAFDELEKVGSLIPPLRDAATEVLERFADHAQTSSRRKLVILEASESRQMYDAIRATLSRLKLAPPPPHAT